MTEIVRTSVLIVGAGPIGLATAIDLGWRGVDCILIDQEGQADTVLPRASGLSSRTMEFFRRWGIVERITKAGFPQDYRLDIVYCTSLCGYMMERELYEPLGMRPAPLFSPHERHRCPQMMLDPVLESIASEHPSVSIRRLHKLVSFEQDDKGVTARVKRLDKAQFHNFSGENVEKLQYGVSQNDDADLSIWADYMVACDGVDSGIRNALDIDLDGTPLINYTISILFKSAYLQKQHKMGEAERYMMIGPEGVWGNLTVVDGREDWRLSLLGSATKFDLKSIDAEAIVRRCIGSDDIPFTVEVVAPWRRREVVAKRLREGRIFLAGDAAHAMSPTGGFGLNAGIGDSIDLGWKLEAMLQGWGGDGLMESYHIERKPVGTRFVQAATSLFKPWLLKLDYEHVLDQSEVGDKARASIGSTLKRELYPEWEIAGTTLGYRYDISPICVSDGTPPPADEPMVYIQTSRPGSRAPHAWLPDGRSTIDLFGRGFVMLRFGDKPVDVARFVAAAAERRVPLTVVDIADPAISGLYERKLVLVRPDGHVAWRGDSLPKNSRHLVDVVRGDSAALAAESSNAASARVERIANG